MTDCQHTSLEPVRLLDRTHIGYLCRRCDVPLPANYLCPDCEVEAIMSIGQTHPVRFATTKYCDVHAPQ